MAPVQQRRTTALALAAVAVALSAACAPLDALTGAAGSSAASPPARLSTAAPSPGQATVLGTGVPETPAPVPFPSAAVAPDPFATMTLAPPSPRPVTASPTPAPSETATCDLRTRRTVPFLATGSPGQAGLSWYSHGGGSLRGWRIAVVPQQLVSGEQPPLRWQEVAAPPGCTTVSTTVTGLVSGQSYSFWLHAELATPLDTTPTLEMVGRTTPLLIP